MLQAESFTTGGEFDRRLHVLEIPDDSDFAFPRLNFDRKCAVLLAWDATAASVEQVAKLGEALLAEGAVYLCCWGRGCERVHDIFDEVLLGSDPPRSEHSDFVMTTWHADDTLDDAIWYLLFTANPSEELVDDCRDAIVISVGNPDWSARARVAFADPSSFSDEVLARSDAV